MMIKTFVCAALIFSMQSVFAVEKCFYCAESCDSSSVVEYNCKKYPENPVNVSCFSSRTNVSGVVTVYKGCLPSDVAEEACTRANGNRDTDCYVCTSDLCNRDNSNSGQDGMVAQKMIILVAVSVFMFK